MTPSQTIKKLLKIQDFKCLKKRPSKNYRRHYAIHGQKELVSPKMRRFINRLKDKTVYFSKGPDKPVFFFTRIEALNSETFRISAYFPEYVDATVCSKLTKEFANFLY
jgi:hypothetical protein